MKNPGTLIYILHLYFSAGKLQTDLTERQFSKQTKKTHRPFALKSDCFAESRQNKLPADIILSLWTKQNPMTYVFFKRLVYYSGVIKSVFYP